MWVHATAIKHFPCIQYGQSVAMFFFRVVWHLCLVSISSVTLSF